MAVQGAELKADIYTTVCTGLRIVGSSEWTPAGECTRRAQYIDHSFGEDIGNRQDAIEALEFAARGQVKPQIAVEPLANLQSGE